MRFLVDVCVSRRVVEFLEARGHGIVLVQDRNPRLGDAEILRWAHADGLVLVTNDKDLGRHIFQEKEPHGGVIRLPNAPGPVLVALMGRIVDVHSPDLAAGVVITASRDRLRVRRREV